MNIQSINSSAVTATTNPVRQPTAAQSAAEATRTTSETQAPAATGENAAVTSENLTSAVKAVNDFVNSVNSNLLFSVDDDTGKTIVKVVDKNPDEVIRQIPSEEMLSIAKALDNIKGLLVKQKA